MGLQLKAFFTTELPSKSYPNEKLHPLGEGNGVCNGPLDVVSVDVGVAEAPSDISTCGPWTCGRTPDTNLCWCYCGGFWGALSNGRDGVLGRL